MKGFGIEIKNNLLEPKHIEKMGMAVWLYMFLIDKMTSVAEDGRGLVLGGRPLKFEEIKKELGISQNTYTRWVDKLLTYPYIEITRTPYGLVFKVLKAHKRWKKRITKNGESPKMERDSPQTGNVIRSTINRESNKTRTLTDTKDNTIIAPNGAGKEINELIGFFEKVNPSFERLYPNKTERKALERMVKKHGREKIEYVIKKLEVTNKVPYAPTITTPYQLEKKLGNLIAFYQRKKAESEKNKITTL